ncbi:(d)CMP kinase [Mycoplasma crocodyli]|uniref:Cytidylate kinase n=1 Tax=Mycoplasma crocodyli (strain ATCC 51981 / MP145) TaxID=512564 RepID=D5E672_MYCCM|nr:(d)CMP kinase [Mycoplasma crocodyli]ADE19765.1 cytidylate kinase [Mycoplasma crocodyli MP145]
MNKVNIAIDGPAGAGKSTVSKEIARRLNYTFINSGSMYRAIAYNAIMNNVDLNIEEEVNKTLKKGMIELKLDESVWLNGKDVSNLIRAEHISRSSAIVAKYQQVRNFVVDYIHNMTKTSKGFIMDGRDTTFKLMPHAEVKIFLWADAKERAKRRYLQNESLGFQTSLEEVLLDVKHRDEQDMNRKVDPLHKTEDATLIDCTFMNFEEVVNKIIELVNTTATKVNNEK